MEAIPKMSLLSFELKVCTEYTHFGPKLKQYISEVYKEDPDSYSDEMYQLENLRSAAVKASTDSDGLKLLTRYFCQLKTMQSRFPMNKNQPAACTFGWKDLYANVVCSIADIRYEMACILYNIGAMHSQLGASEPRTSMESLKSAFSHYQSAAWAFQQLRDDYAQPNGVDVSSEIVKLIQEICMAQAQECILEKSIQDAKKPCVIGAVGAQVLVYYKNSLSFLGPATDSDNIYEIIGSKMYNYWHRYLSFKKSYISCIVCLYQGMNSEEQQKMGERVAFYQLAKDELAAAMKLAKYIEPVAITIDALTFANDVVEGKWKGAKNENEFIYHEAVPEKDMLQFLKPVCLVSLMSINFDDPEVTGNDIFKRLVPIGTHEASSIYSEEKAKLLRRILEQVDAKDIEMSEFMSSLQLDQLDVLDTKQTVPQEIVDRCAAMNAKKEIIQNLVDSMNSLAEIITDVEHSLDEIKNLIEEETTKEKEYQKVMGRRPPSIVQTELSREYHKYQEAHARTNESNQVLHKAMMLHIANLKLLAQPLNVLQSKIPTVNKIEGVDRETMRELRRVVGKAREMRAQRDSLVQELRAAVAADDVTPALLAANKADATAIFAREIDKHTPKVNIIEQNLAAQQNIINRLTSLYATYGESRRLISEVLRKREALVNALVTSYDSHSELLAKSQKGLEFYKKLSANVNQLLTRVRSATQVQDEERTQLLASNTARASVTNKSKVDVAGASVAKDAPPKLKDYLPFMNKGAVRGMPQAPVLPMASESYCPDANFPTSMRPAPLGSEATDVQPPNIPDGVVPAAMQNQYHKYLPYANNEINPGNYQNTFNPMTSQPPEDNSNYSAYTPSHHSSHMVNPQSYTNPYYAGSQESPVTDRMTDSNIYNVSQANTSHNQNYNMYNNFRTGVNMMAPVTDNPTSSNYADMNMSFAQMNLSGARMDSNMSYGQLGQPFYTVNYPEVSTPNLATYSNAGLNSNTTMVQSQFPSEYAHSANPPIDQLGNSNTPHYIPQAPYSISSSTISYDNISQGYSTPANFNPNTAGLDASVANLNPSMAPYASVPDKNINPALSQIDALDKPIKSHVTGEAVSANYSNYTLTDASSNHNYSNFPEQNAAQNTDYAYPNQANVNYLQTYTHNNPAYMYNAVTGQYEYNYGTQGIYADHSIQENMGPHSASSIYTLAGSANTTQTVSVSDASMSQANNQVFSSGGYMPVSNPPVELANTPVNYTNFGVQQDPIHTQYGASQNIHFGGSQDNNVQSNAVQNVSNMQTGASQAMIYMPSSVAQNTTQVTHGAIQDNYMHSGTNQDNMATGISQQMSYTYPDASQNVSQMTPNTNQDSYVQSVTSQSTCNLYSNSSQITSDMQLATNQDVNITSDKSNIDVPISNEAVENSTLNMNTYQSNEVNIEKTETTQIHTINDEPKTSAIDLLCDIDFTVNHEPLVPDIKVPQISESLIKKPILTNAKQEPKKIEEETIQRPPKREIFSDPSLLNKFTQEVKKLQNLVDSLTDKTPSGLTVLDAKWKKFQDLQVKENSKQSKLVASRHSENSVSDIVAYDNTRLTLKDDPDLFINASYYKQLSPWCVRLVVCSTPAENEHDIFWKIIVDNKVTYIICLLGETETAGKIYWPTTKNQTLQLSRGVTVTLEDVKPTVHWTERLLTVTSEKKVLKVTHYQIVNYSAKIVCPPLVMLADVCVRACGAGLGVQEGGVCAVQSAEGGGRAAAFALLLAAVSEVRAGGVHLIDTIESACANLYKGRTNVLEDAKHLAHAYRAALYYAQGVLLSGSTMFNGNAVTNKQTMSATQSTLNIHPSSGGARANKSSRETFEEMKQAPGLKSGDMKDPLNFLDPLWSLKKK